MSYAYNFIDKRKKDKRKKIKRVFDAPLSSTRLDLVRIYFDKYTNQEEEAPFQSSFDVWSQKNQKMSSRSSLLGASLP